MKTIKSFAWLALLTVIQCVFVSALRIGGVFAELFFVFSLCCAYFEKKSEYYFLAVSVVCGLIAGSVYGGNTVFYLIVYTASAWAVSEFSNLLYSKIFPPIIPIVMIMTFLENSLFYAVSGLFASYASAVAEIILPSVVYNTAAAVIIGFAVKKTVCK